MPLISVIVPVYNVECYIDRCVNSILIQTMPDFELILVDDGSPDNCGNICDSYAILDSRVRVIHRHNGGLSAARNSGLDWVFKNSNSEWITFIDSDDWVHPRYLELLYRAIKKNKCQISVCGFIETDGTVAIDSSIRESIVVPVEKFYCESTVNATIACGKLYPIGNFKSLRFPAGKVHEDEYVTYRILFECEKIAFIPMPLYMYYINQNSITHVKWTPRRLDILKAFEKQIAFFKRRGLQDCAEMRIGNYMWNVEQQLQTLDELGEEFDRYKRKYKRILGSILIRWREKYPFRYNKKRYEVAFPKAMWVYWQIKRLLYFMKLG